MMKMCKYILKSHFNEEEVGFLITGEIKEISVGTEVYEQSTLRVSLFWQCNFNYSIGRIKMRGTGMCVYSL